MCFIAFWSWKIVKFHHKLPAAHGKLAHQQGKKKSKVSIFSGAGAQASVASLRLWKNNASWNHLPLQVWTISYAFTKNATHVNSVGGHYCQLFDFAFCLAFLTLHSWNQLNAGQYRISISQAQEPSRRQPSRITFLAWQEPGSGIFKQPSEEILRK